MYLYILRRIIYAIPILISVNVLTFFLFFIVNTPDDIANLHVGNKYVSKEVIEDWKEAHGYHLPLFYNHDEYNLDKITETIFFQKSIKLFALDFGVSDSGRDISDAISDRIGPSLYLAIPAFFLSLIANVFFAMVLVLFKNTYLHAIGTIKCVILMSISLLFYIIGGQYIFAKVLKLVPISGYLDGSDGIKFLILPVLVSIFGNIGAGTRLYRSFFIEEMSKDYVLSARAKGLSYFQVLYKHVLRNALIPILTGVVAVLPLLFMGSLLLEAFFGIPGLGSYTIDAIRNQDFAVVRVMVFLGSALYILGLTLTDISYVIVDPRISLAKNN